jgi:simple sugar transport system substrate-binding protein
MGGIIVKKIISLLMASVITFSLAACGSSSNSATSTPGTSAASSTADTSAKKTFTIATVPKMTSIAWFQRMEQGVKKYAADTGMDAYYIGPATEMRHFRHKLLKT